MDLIYLLWSILTLQQCTGGKSLGTARFAHSAGRCPKESSAGKSHVQTLRLISFKLFTSHMFYKFQKHLKSWGWVALWLHGKALWMFFTSSTVLVRHHSVSPSRVSGICGMHYNASMEMTQVLLDISNVAACFHCICSKFEPETIQQVVIFRAASKIKSCP